MLRKALRLSSSVVATTLWLALVSLPAGAAPAGPEPAEERTRSFDIALPAGRTPTAALAPDGRLAVGSETGSVQVVTAEGGGVFVDVQLPEPGLWVGSLYYGGDNSLYANAWDPARNWVPRYWKYDATNNLLWNDPQLGRVMPVRNSDELVFSNVEVGEWGRSAIVSGEPPFKEEGWLDGVNRGTSTARFVAAADGNYLKISAWSYSTWYDQDKTRLAGVEAADTSPSTGTSVLRFTLDSTGGPHHVEKWDLGKRLWAVESPFGAEHGELYSTADGGCVLRAGYKIARLDSAGVVKWTVDIGPSSGEVGFNFSMSVDADGNIALVKSYFNVYSNNSERPFDVTWIGSGGVVESSIASFGRQHAGDYIQGVLIGFGQVWAWYRTSTSEERLLSVPKSAANGDWRSSMHYRGDAVSGTATNDPRNVPPNQDVNSNWWDWPDDDEDGIPNHWETNGVWANDRFADLPTMGLDPKHKDLIVRMDYEEGWAPHAFTEATMVDHFAKAPLENPDGRDGVKLHYVYGEPVPTNIIGNFHTDWEAVKPVMTHTGFITDPLSGDARVPQLAKWILSVKPGQDGRDYLCAGSKASGCAGLRGGIGWVAVDAVDGFTATLSVNMMGWTEEGRQYAQDFVLAVVSSHELGHQLGLNHHGSEPEPEADPDYKSIMSYAYSHFGIPDGFLGLDLPRSDYSRESTVNLDWQMGKDVGKLTFVRGQYGDVIDFYANSSSRRWGDGPPPVEQDFAQALKDADPDAVAAFLDGADVPFAYTAPTLSETMASVRPGAPIEITLDGHDPMGPVAYVVDAQSTLGTAEPTPTGIRFTAHDGVAGTANVAVRAVGPVFGSKPALIAIEVAQSAPTAGTVTVTPVSATAGKVTFTASPAGFADADNDEFSYTYVWTHNGTVVGDDSDTLTATVADGDTVAVSVIATDTHGATSQAAIDSVTVAAPVSVTAAAVTFIDVCGTEGDTFTIPSTTGVEYVVDGQVKGAGTYAGTGAVTVTARATTGYVLESITGWSNTFDATTCPVTPAAVTFTDGCGTANDTYTIPTTTGVQYLVDSQVKPAHTYPTVGSVTVKAQPATGYVLEGATTWTNTFTSASAFLDVTPSTQFFDEMCWLANNGISTGWIVAGGAEYRPVQPVKRDAMAAFMYRLAGSPTWEPPVQSPFLDVTPSTQFYKEITWLADQGISTGWQLAGGAEYRPVQPVNRDAMAAFMYRYEGKPAFTAPTASPFVDMTPETQFYLEVSWLADEGISTGWDDGTFRPTQPVNRDAMAAFMYRLNVIMPAA